MSSPTTDDLRVRAPASGAEPTPGALFLTVFPSIMLPMFLAVADQTIVATALPAIVSDLGEIERASWIVVAYLIAATVAAPVYGRFGDTIGRRQMMFVALAVFIAASVLCALSVNIEMLAAMRVLQGLGGGGLMTISQALIGEAIPPRQRARYQGYLAAVAVTSSAFGPVAGGYLTETFGWQSIFLVNVPIGLVAILLVMRLPPRAGQPAPGAFDTLGLVLFATFVSAIVLALERIQHADMATLPTSGALLALGAVSVVLLWRREQRAASPLLPISLMRQPAVWRSDALAACHGAALVSLITFLPIYLRAARGASPSEAGLLLLPLTAGIGVGSVITGRIVSKTGCTAILPFIGLMVVTASLLFLAFWAPHLSIRELPWVFGLNALFMGTVMGVVQVTVQAVAGPQLLGAAAATVQFSRSVGAAFGTAAVAAVLFAVLAATDRETAALFGTIIEQGPDALATIAPARQAVIQAEIGNAFRAAFLTIATFTAGGVWLAWTMPLRRI
jgi:EmrB/QacA subfamily drug resistance transporter